MCLRSDERDEIDLILIGKVVKRVMLVRFHGSYRRRCCLELTMLPVLLGWRMASIDTLPLAGLAQRSVLTTQGIVVI